VTLDQYGGATRAAKEGRNDAGPHRSWCAVSAMSSGPPPNRADRLDQEQKRSSPARPGGKAFVNHGRTPAFFEGATKRSTLLRGKPQGPPPGSGEAVDSTRALTRSDRSPSVRGNANVTQRPPQKRLRRRDGPSMTESLGMVWLAMRCWGELLVAHDWSMRYAASGIGVRW
jgi:hypothetical protein